jgi:two-component system, LuxR family, sensor kinase FixL
MKLSIPSFVSPGERAVPVAPPPSGQESAPGLLDTQREELLRRDLTARMNAEPAGRTGEFLRTVCGMLGCAVCYYVATQIAWSLCFPDSKVSLFFPPHAVLVSILLLVPTRQWWAYTLAAASAHFLATQQAHWPPLYAVTCEAFDAVKYVSAAAGIRLLIKSPLKALTLRDAVLFVLVAVVLVPFGAAFWGAAFTVSNGFGTHYWIEWRNLGISNAVTTVVLVPALLLGAHNLFVRRPKVPFRRALEAALVGACTVAIGILVFDKTPAGPGTSPPLLYTPIPLLIWAALRFGLGGTSVSMLIITFLAIWGTMRGHGPFLNQTPVENALALQLFLLMTATPLMLLAVVIEEERRSKEALRQSKDQMGLAAEAANAALWVWDVSADALWMTEQGRSMFGFKPDARINFAATLDRTHPEDRATRESAIRRALETRSGYEIEYRLLEADGVVRWINGRARCVEPNDGTGLKLFGVSIDVTARKQAEASAAQKRAQLEHVARVATLGELTATLTHELRQPLHAILMNSAVGIHLLDAPEPDLQELRDTLTDIGETTKRAAEVISGLRGMLKRDTPGFTNVDLNHLIRAVERIAHGDAMQHGVTVGLDLSPSVLPITGDTVQLQQVMLNLMLNAFGAMNESERGARRLIVRTSSMDGSNVLIEVQDSGTGIPPEKLESIFDPFITSKPEGLGMGLSICRTIVERHGGKIWAANNPDRGATFSITIPITPGRGRSESAKFGQKMSQDG